MYEAQKAENVCVLKVHLKTSIYIIRKTAE